MLLRVHVWVPPEVPEVTVLELELTVEVLVLAVEEVNLVLGVDEVILCVLVYECCLLRLELVLVAVDPSRGR